MTEYNMSHPASCTHCGFINADMREDYNRHKNGINDDGWIVVETAGQVHVLPHRTESNHVRDTYCFCKPNLENLNKRLVIHNDVPNE